LIKRQSEGDNRVYHVAVAIQLKDFLRRLARRPWKSGPLRGPILSLI